MFTWIFSTSVTGNKLICREVMSEPLASTLNYLKRAKHVQSKEGQDESFKH